MRVQLHSCYFHGSLVFTRGVIVYLIIKQMLCRMGMALSVHLGPDVVGAVHHAEFRASTRRHFADVGEAPALEQNANKAAVARAVAVLKGSPGVEGVVKLEQVSPQGPTKLHVRLTGLAPGKHGFHVHESGDISNGCLSTKAHFNPNKLQHGGPGDKIRHAGDLGNVVADSTGSGGVAELNLEEQQISLSGKASIIGRAFVVHELEDDLGKGGQELSLSTGNAGGRLACGVIGLIST